METILKILSVIGTILVPILVAHLTSKNSIRRHPKEEFADDVRNAKEFEALIDTDEPNLIKDRVAQQLFQSKKINFKETVYFRQFENMEYWGRGYIPVKKFILLNRDDEHNVQSMSFQYSYWKRARYLSLYMLTASIGLSLVLWFNSIKVWLNINFNWPSLLTIIIVALWAFIFMAIGIFNLLSDRKYADTNVFVNDFNKNSIKLE